MSTRRRGFTLIEVLVALAIVAFGMAAVLAAMTSAADNAFYLREKSLAEWVALNQLATTRLKGKIPAKGKTEGTVENFAGRTWFWQQEVLALQIKGMWRIDVSVRPLQSAESKSDASSKRASWYATVSGVMGDAIENAIYGATDYDICNPIPVPGVPDCTGSTGTGRGPKTPSTPANPNPSTEDDSE